MSTQHTPGAQPKPVPSFLLLPCCTKVLAVSQGLLQGDEGWGRFRTPPGTSSPDPAAPKAEPCHRICCSKGPYVGQHSGICLKCRFLSPARWDRLLSLFTRLSSDCGPLRWGLCPRIWSSWMGAGGRLREDADRQLAQGQGEKLQGKAPGFDQQRELWAFKPPGCPQPARQTRRKGFQKALPGPAFGCAKLCMLFDNCILLIKQFYRLSPLSLPIFLSFTHSVIVPGSLP